MSKLDSIRSIQKTLDAGMFSGQGIASPTQREISNALERIVDSESDDYPDKVYVDKQVRPELDSETLIQLYCMIMRMRGDVNKSAKLEKGKI